MGIYRVITTTLQSCRSKDPSNLPQDPVRSFPRLSSDNPKSSTVHFQHPKDVQTNRPSFKHHVSSALVYIGCGLPYTDEPSNDDITASQPPEFAWREEDKWHVVAKIYEPPRKIYNSSSDDLTFAPPISAAVQPASTVGRNRRLTRNKKKKNVPSRIRISTSSAASGWFSSDGGVAADEETETLVSSSISCLSAGSSSEHLPPIRESQPFSPILPHRRSANKRRSANNHRQRRGGGEKSNSSKPTADEDVPARLSVFKKLIPCTVDGKVKESFAIVKRSSDPYQDFKNSMMDMIIEKQMFEAGDLEQLLQCFLSLNSRYYHGVIVEAFSEICEAIFCPARAEGGLGI